jgi:hypothetical protein
MSGSTTEELKSERASADKANLDEKNSLDRTASPAPAEDDADTPVYPGGWKLTLIVSSLCLAVFLVALDQTIIAPALGAITAEYKSVKDIVSFQLRGECEMRMGTETC